MDSLISTFHIDWKIIIAQAFNFAIVFAVLYIFALKPLQKIMAERAEKIARGVNDAKSNAEILEKTKAEYDAVITKARAEAHTLFQEGKKDAEAKKAKMLEEAKAQVDAMIQNGKVALEAEKTKMVEEAKKEIVNLAMLATEKLMKERHDKAVL